MLISLNLFFGILLLLNIKLLDKLNGIQDYILFATNFIILIHIWWGASFLLKKISSPRSILDWMIAITILTSLVLASFYVDNPIRWFIIYAIAFSLVIIQYLRYKRYCRTKEQKKYIITKVAIEKWAILGFFIGFMILLTFNNEWVYLSIVSLTLFLQIPFILYVVFVKKVYQIC